MCDGDDNNNNNKQLYFYSAFQNQLQGASQNTIPYNISAKIANHREIKVRI